MDRFIDERDGNSYRVIKIGGLLWFAENLRYQGVPHYFPGRDSDNLHKYGCLYTWENAMKACPDGWHLPTSEEFERLVTTTGADGNASSIRDSSWARGSNSRGFGALPAGVRSPNSSANLFDFRAYFWSATSSASDDFAYCLSLGYGSADVFSYGVKTDGYSVRCVKEG